MIKHDRAVLDFAVKWRHWGGAPDEDIFVTFGVAARQYFARVLQLLRSPGHGLPTHIVTAVEQVCRTRLDEEQPERRVRRRPERRPQP